MSSIQNFAHFLKAARQKRNMSQDELSKQIGKTRGLIARWESSLLTPSEQDAEKLCGILKQDLSDVLEAINLSRFQQKFLKLVDEFSPRVNRSHIKYLVEAILFEDAWELEALEAQIASINESDKVKAFQEFAKIGNFLTQILNGHTSQAVQESHAFMKSGIPIGPIIPLRSAPIPQKSFIPIKGSGLIVEIVRGPAIQRSDVTSKPTFWLELRGIGKDFSDYEDCQVRVAIEQGPKRLELTTASPDTRQGFEVKIEKTLNYIEVPSGLLPREAISLNLTQANH